MNTSRRIVKNSMFLYIKMVLVVLMSLYSTRLILNAFGERDFGIYNLIAGVIAMFAFVNAAITVSTQRYLSYNLGTGRIDKRNEVFASSISLHLIIGSIVVLILESVGLFFFDAVLNIPIERAHIARILYHIVVFNTFISIVFVPLDALISAHEDMLLDSVLGVVEYFFRLLLAIGLVYISVDKLLFYSIGLTLLSLLVLAAKYSMCRKRYEECKFNTISSSVKLSTIKEMFSFAAWNLFGALCGVGTTQGIAVILNVFFGPIINASYAISTQVTNQMFMFSANILKAINPQIMKSEGEGKRERMLQFAELASRASFAIFAFFAIPLFFEMDFVLKLWLKVVPEYSVAFCRLTILVFLIRQLSVGLMSAAQSTGNVKTYQVLAGSIMLINLPAGYLLLWLGNSVYWIFFVSIGLEIAACVFRLFYLKGFVGLNVMTYFKKVILSNILFVLFEVSCIFILTLFVRKTLLGVGVILAFSVFTFIIGSYFLILTKDEKLRFSRVISNYNIGAFMRGGINNI